MAGSTADPKGPELEIRSEAHGPHWVAWLQGADGKPQDAVLVVGQTQDEAESRARKWAVSRRGRA